MKKQANVFILKMRDVSEKFCYSSLDALYTEYGHKFDVTKDRIGKVLREQGFFENPHAFIERFTVSTKGDVVKRMSPKP